MGTVNVKNQYARFERADVMCPVPWCGAVREQPCKRRGPYRLSVSEKLHPERYRAQRKWEDEHNIPESSRRKLTEPQGRRKQGKRRRRRDS